MKGLLIAFALSIFSVSARAETAAVQNESPLSQCITEKVSEFASSEGTADALSEYIATKCEELEPSPFMRCGGFKEPGTIEETQAKICREIEGSAAEKEHEIDRDYIYELLIMARTPSNNGENRETDNTSSLGHTEILRGKCQATSHIAEGKIGEDLRKRRSQFFCDSAIITFLDQSSTHLMVQFSDSKSKHRSPIGFAGLMQEDKIMDVKNVYLEVGQPTPATDAYCKFFYKNGHVTGIFCGAKIDEDGMRTIPVIAFDANASH